MRFAAVLDIHLVRYHLIVIAGLPVIFRVGNLLGLLQILSVIAYFVNAPQIQNLIDHLLSFIIDLLFHPKQLVFYFVVPLLLERFQLIVFDLIKLI